MLKGFRFQKRISILPGLLRLNLSKSGVSASAGPRGADINIGKNGVTTNAGIPGTGISYRQKAGGGKTWMAVLTVVAGLGVWGFQHIGKVEKLLGHAKTPPAATQTATPQQAPAAAQAAAVTPVNTTGAAVRYVHRSGSVIRSEPKTSAKTLKKESKGEPVTVLADQADGWTQVRAGDVTGWMRTSVLGTEPPK